MITIEQRAVDAMTTDAVRSFPDECCGFLFGSETGGHRIVTEIMVVKNSQEGDKRRKFIISPRDYLRAEQFAEDNKIRFLGIYHSHPDHPAIPSEYDREAAQPYFSYIILSVLKGYVDTIRSWRLDDDSEFKEEVIQFNQIIKQETWQQ